MSEESATLFAKAHESQTKFDYFLCSVAGALFAYIVQTYRPQKLDNFFSVLQTVSLLVLALSFYAGIRRIQMANMVTRLSLDELSAAEAAGKLTENLGEKFKIYEHTISGEAASPEALRLKRDNLLNQIEACKTHTKRAATRARIFGAWQLRLLLAGFGIILLSKVLQPYESDFFHQPVSIKQSTNAPTQSILDIPSSKPAKQ